MCLVCVDCGKIILICVLFKFFSINDTKFPDENGKAMRYEDETMFSRIEEWRMVLEQKLGVENFLHGK